MGTRLWNYESLWLLALEPVAGKKTIDQSCNFGGSDLASGMYDCFQLSDAAFFASLSNHYGLIESIAEKGNDFWWPNAVM